MKLPVSRREELARVQEDLAEDRSCQLGIFSSRPIALVVIEKQQQIKFQEQAN